MIGNLFDSVVKKPQRESAGASTAARFDYQKNWAFCQMIERHQADDDYLVAFEFHDDVVFFDKEISPEQIDFIQVKTSKSVKPRTLASVTHRKDNASSIIGKMIKNAEGLEADQSIRFILVSNNAFEFSEDNLCAAELDNKYKEKLLLKMKEEFVNYDNDHLESLFFWVTKIPVDEIETFLLGKATVLFEKKFGANFSYNVSTWLRLVQGEISRKNNFSPEQIGTVQQMISKKCIGKTFIDGTLDEISKKHKNTVDIALINERLSESGWSDISLLRFDKDFSLARADFLNPTNEECRTLQKNTRDVLKSYDLESMNIAKILETVFEDLNKSNLIPGPYRNKEYICALTVLVIYEGL